MILALIRLARMGWASTVLFLSKLWSRLLVWKLLEANAINVNAQEDVDKLTAEGRELGSREFPAPTDDQYSQLRNSFIESLDSDAVCALASQYNHGSPCRVVKKDSGSFNVCFFIEFDQCNTKWVVRVSIDPALDNPWHKILSEVTTLRYVKRNTRIPVPHVHAYGRDARLTKTGDTMQMFLILDCVIGEPLDKKLLVDATIKYRRSFYCQLVDILAELRKLEFPAIGSLMPPPNSGESPVLGPVISMSAHTLRRPLLPIFASAREYMSCQFGLVSAFFLPPVRDLTLDDLQQEVFALRNMEGIFEQVIHSDLDKGPFVLGHLDLRSPNIIVDKHLNIQGVIDWEFSSTIPRQLFTPPSWITGHDSITTDKQIHAEFREALDERSKASALCDQMRREWYDQPAADEFKNFNQTELTFCVAHVLRRPTDVTDMFYDFLAQTLFDEPIENVISQFFAEHEALALEARRRADQCQRYTQYLKDHGLYETEEEKQLAKLNKLTEWIREKSEEIDELQACLNAIEAGAMDSQGDTN